jgi:hypothetical protein
MNYWDICTYRDFRKFVNSGLLTDSRYDKSTPKMERNGFATITLKNWRLLEPLLYTMVEMSHAIFRGINQNGKKDYDLRPSIFRTFLFKHESTLDQKNEYITRCYRHFVHAISGRRGPLSKPVDNYRKFELWSLGRHYGVRNTMLDWSRSPYVSLFFAFANRHDKGVRSLYCLKRNVIDDAGGRTSTPIPRVGSSERSEEDDILLTVDPDFDSLLFYEPLSDENFRMINQQGVFTVSRSPHSIEQWVARNYRRVLAHLQEMRRKASDAESKKRLDLDIKSRWILLRIDIVTDMKKKEPAQILRWLNRMNIHYASLFPDIEGASLYANMQGDIRHY